MQTFHAQVGNYKLQFDCTDCAAVRSNLKSRGLKVVDKAVPRGHYMANTEIKNDMKITTFGAQTNFNA